MSLGKPAILTNWSGNTDYMTPDNSIGIGYEMVRVGRNHGPYTADQWWAWSRTLTKRQRTGCAPAGADQPSAWPGDREIAGDRTIEAEFSPQVVGERIRSRLRNIPTPTLSDERRQRPQRMTCCTPDTLRLLRIQCDALLSPSRWHESDRHPGGPGIPCRTGKAQGGLHRRGCFLCAVRIPHHIDPRCRDAKKGHLLDARVLLASGVQRLLPNIVATVLRCPRALDCLHAGECRRSGGAPRDCGRCSICRTSTS